MSGLRPWLDLRESSGALVTVERTVDPRFEIPALLAKLDGRATLLVRDAGAGRALAGNLAMSREDFGVAAAHDWRALPERLAEIAVSAAEPTEPRAEPTGEFELEASGTLADELVVCTHHRHDGGPYLTSAVVMLRDPDGGRLNWSINRLQLAGPRELRALVQHGNARAVIESWWARGEDAPVAIALGVDPLAHLATQLRGTAPVDGLAAYELLSGGPVATAIGPDTRIEAPASVEFLLEGQIRRDRYAVEGPFGEFPRTYGAAHDGGLIVEVSAIRHRERPICQTILPAGREHLLLGGLAREGAILRQLRAEGIDPVAVRLTEGGSCRFHAAVSCSAPNRDGREIVEAVVEADPLVKHVLLVDADVDVHDSERLEWAVATRFRAERDLVLLPYRAGTKLDPVSEQGRVTKIGIDARVGEDMDGASHKRIDIPGLERLELADYVT